VQGSGDCGGQSVFRWRLLANLVVSTFFGFAPSVDGKNTLTDPQTPKPFTGRLLHVSSRGERFTISAGEKGASVLKERSQI